MSDSDPNQLRLNLGSDNSDILDELGSIESPLEPEIIYQNSRGEKITYDQIDQLATAQGVLPLEVMSRLGITAVDTDAEKPRPKRGRQSVETIIAERAITLMGAAYQYREAANYDMDMRNLLLSGAESSEVDRATVAEMTHRYAGDVAIGKLNRTKDLEKAGFSRIGLGTDASRSIEDFRDLSTNPDRQDELIELVKVLKTQLPSK